MGRYFVIFLDVAECDHAQCLVQKNDRMRNSCITTAHDRSKLHNVEQRRSILPKKRQKCRCRLPFPFSNQITPEFLLPLNSLEQALEVPRTEAIEVISLDNLNKDCGAIHQVLGEQLQQVAALVEIDENI